MKSEKDYVHTELTKREAEPFKAELRRRGIYFEVSEMDTEWVHICCLCSETETEELNKWIDRNL